MMIIIIITKAENNYSLLERPYEEERGKSAAFGRKTCTRTSTLNSSSI